MSNEEDQARTAIGDVVAVVHTLNLKQRAVLFAMLGDCLYADLARAMRVDVTTVKLHARAVLNRLGLKDQDALRAHSKNILEALAQAGADKPFTFGVALNWMKDPSNSGFDALGEWHVAPGKDKQH
jgi:DNA-binding NarL/FixJ family response regulator